MDALKSGEVGFVYPLGEGVLNVIDRAIEKADANLENGFKKEYEMCKARARGAFDVFRVLANEEQIKAWGKKIFKAMGSAQLDLPQMNTGMNLIHGVEGVVFAALNRSVLAGAENDLESFEKYREEAVGALGVFDMCSTKEEKAMYRVELLAAIFPVDG